MTTLPSENLQENPDRIKNSHNLCKTHYQKILWFTKKTESASCMIMIQNKTWSLSGLDNTVAGCPAMTKVISKACTPPELWDPAVTKDHKEELKPERLQLEYIKGRLLFFTRPAQLVDFGQQCKWGGLNHPRLQVSWGRLNINLSVTFRQMFALRTSKFYKISFLQRI